MSAESEQPPIRKQSTTATDPSDRGSPFGAGALDSILLEKESHATQEEGPSANALSTNPAEGEDHAVTPTKGQDAPALEEAPKRKVVLIMGALCLAVFLAALDMSIVATALPSIASEFKITQDEYNWIGSAYMLGCAAFTPPWGKISDIWGRRPTLLFSNIVFLIGSLLCGVAVNINMLIAGRTVQGAGAGGLLSLVNTCIADLFSQRKRGLYYSYIGGVWAVAGAFGPILGGALAEYSTWRWCFYINLPCDGVAFLVLYFFLDIHTPTTPILSGLAAIDWLGLATSVAGIVLFLIGLESGGVSHPWSSPFVICLIVSGVVLLILFVIIEWKIAKYPVMPLHLFNSLPKVVVFVTRFCHGVVFISASYFLPLYFQAVLDSTPFESGVKQLPYILGTSLPGMVAVATIRRTGDYKTPIVGGMFLMTLGFGLFIYLPDYANYARIIPAEIIAGLGTGPNFIAPLIALQAQNDPADIATLSSAYAFIGQSGCAISVVVGGAILQNRLSSYTGILAPVLNDAQLKAIAGGGAGSSVNVIQQLPQPAKSIVQGIFAESLQSIWIFYTVIAFCGLIATLFIQRKTLDQQHTVRRQGLETEEQNRLDRLARKKGVVDTNGQAKKGERNAGDV